LRQLPVTTDPGARLLEVVSRLGGATSHATPSFTSARLREPRFQPLRGSPQLARLPTAEASNADRQRVNAVRCARSSRMNAQTPASVFNGPEHWRQRAEEARRMADLMSNIPSKEAMLRIAEDYVRLAKRAEERAKRSPSSATRRTAPPAPAPESARGVLRDALDHQRTGKGFNHQPKILPQVKPCLGMAL
jgi:hypothetical protein